MPNPSFNTEILSAALVGLEIEKRKLDEKIAEVRAMLGGRTPAVESDTDSAAKPTHKRSAAARRKMALAQKARWAKVKGEVAAPKAVAKKAPAKPKRALSAAGRAAIVAALKKRWAVKKAAAKKAE